MAAAKCAKTLQTFFVVLCNLKAQLLLDSKIGHWSSNIDSE